MTEPARPKRPEYDPACGLSRFEWILAASRELRDTRDERMAQEVERINERAGIRRGGSETIW